MANHVFPRSVFALTMSLIEDGLDFGVVIQDEYVRDYISYSLIHTVLMFTNSRIP